MSFGGLLVVAIVGLCAPLAVAALPGLHIPSPVVEILAGIVIGPAVLGVRGHGKLPSRGHEIPHWWPRSGRVRA